MTAPLVIGLDLSLTCAGVAGAGWTDHIRPKNLTGHERLPVAGPRCSYTRTRRRPPMTPDEIALLLDGIAIGILAQTFCDAFRIRRNIRAAEKAAERLHARLDAADARLDAREREQ